MGMPSVDAALARGYAAMGFAATPSTLGDILLLRLTGAVERSGQALRLALADALASRPQALILDLDELQLGTPGARILIETATQARIQGCRMVLCRPRPDDTSRILRLRGGGQLLVFESLEAATEGLLLESGWV